MSFFPTCAMRNRWKLMRSYGESTTLETQSSSSNCGYRIDRDTQHLINSIEKNKNDPQLWNVSVMNHKSWSLKLCAGNRDRSISKKVINAPSNWKTCHQIEVIACSVSTHSHSGFAWLFRERCAKCFPVRNCVNDRRLRQMRCVCVFRRIILMGIYLVACDLFIAAVQVSHTQNSQKMICIVTKWNGTTWITSKWR